LKQLKAGGDDDNDDDDDDNDSYHGPDKAQIY